MTWSVAADSIFIGFMLFREYLQNAISLTHTSRVASSKIKIMIFKFSTVC